MSARLNILQAWETKLQGITVAGGYNNTLANRNVSLMWQDFDNINPEDCPIVVLASGDSPYTPLTDSQYASGSSRSGPDGWTVGVFCYAANSAEDVDRSGLLTAQLEKLAEDIIKMTFTDTTLGGKCQNIYLRAILPYLDDSRPIGVMQLVFEVKYDFLVTAP